MKPIRIAGLFSAALVFGVVTAYAQPVIGAKSGVVNVAEGKVYLADQLLELAADAVSGYQRECQCCGPKRAAPKCCSRPAFSCACGRTARSR